MWGLEIGGGERVRKLVIFEKSVKPGAVVESGDGEIFSFARKYAFCFEQKIEFSEDFVDNVIARLERPVIAFEGVVSEGYGSFK